MGLFAALLLSVVSTSLRGEASAKDGSRTVEETVVTHQGGGAGGLLPDEPAAIVRIICPSGGTVGTAFKHRSGHLLAANTSVRSCSQVMVSLPSGRSVDAQVVARDPQADLAMLLPTQPIPGHALDFSKQPDLSVGAPTGTVGFPAGYTGNSALLITGYIAGVSRLQIDNNRHVTKLILGGNYNSGLSGSPLLDKSGTVVGVLSGTLSPASENAFAALKALKEERGSNFLWEKPGGTKVPLSQAQVVAMVLEEILMQAHFILGLATSLQDLREFMAKNGVDL